MTKKQTIGACGHAVRICPNGFGDAFACNSFCQLCEGSGDFCLTCNELPKCPCGNFEAPGWHVVDDAGITFGGLKRAQNEAARNIAEYIAHVYFTKPDAVFSSLMTAIIDGKHPDGFREGCEWQPHAG